MSGGRVHGELRERPLHQRQPPDVLLDGQREPPPLTIWAPTSDNLSPEIDVEINYWSRKQTLKLRMRAPNKHGNHPCQPRINPGIINVSPKQTLKLTI